MLVENTKSLEIIVNLHVRIAGTALGIVVFELHMVFASIDWDRLLAGWMHYARIKQKPLHVVTGSFDFIEEYIHLWDRCWWGHHRLIPG